MIPARLLFQTEDRACKRLGFEKFSGDRKRVPTAEQFQLLHERVANLEAIIALRYNFLSRIKKWLRHFNRLNRQAEYVTLTDSIRSAWDELEISAQHFEVYPSYLRENICITNILFFYNCRIHPPSFLHLKIWRTLE